jgi:hypothetical protein
MAGSLTAPHSRRAPQAIDELMHSIQVCRDRVASNQSYVLSYVWLLALHPGAAPDRLVHEQRQQRFHSFWSTLAMQPIYHQ